MPDLNYELAPKPGQTAAQRLAELGASRFVAVRNLAYLIYKKPDGSPLMTYPETLDDRERVKSTIIQYELSQGLLVAEGGVAAQPQPQPAQPTAQQPGAQMSQQPVPVTQFPPPASPMQAAQVQQQFQPQAAPQMQFQQPPPQQPQQQFAGAPPMQAAPQQPQQMQFQAPQFQQAPQAQATPATEAAPTARKRRGAGAAVAPPPAAPPPSGPVQAQPQQQFVPQQQFAPQAAPMAAPQFAPQAPQFQGPPFQPNVPQAPQAPQFAQQAAPMAAAPQTALDLGPVLQKIDLLGKGLEISANNSDAALKAVAELRNEINLVLVALNHIYLSMPAPAGQQSLGQLTQGKAGDLPQFRAYLSVYLPK